MKEIIVRRMKTEEYSLLKEFTYMAIYVPHGVKMPPKSIVEQAALSPESAYGRGNTAHPKHAQAQPQ